MAWPFSLKPRPACSRRSRRRLRHLQAPRQLVRAEELAPAMFDLPATIESPISLLHPFRLCGDQLRSDWGGAADLLVSDRPGRLRQFPGASTPQPAADRLADGDAVQ